MSLVWPLPLRPGEKLLLMALADCCNDEGICWPSVKTIAKKASVDERTVQRTLRSLYSRGLLKIEKRFRGDGSQSSNKFTLILPGDNLSLPPVIKKLNRVSALPPSGGNADTQTQRETLLEPPLPTLDFPSRLNPIYRAQILEKFSNVDQTLLKKGLDELADALQHRQINNPVLWLAKVLPNLVTTEGGERKRMIRIKNHIIQ